MDPDNYGSRFNINNKGSALIQREDSTVNFGWNEEDTTGIEKFHGQNKPQWNEFTENTTFHGIKYIFDFKASKLRRALWVCCVLVSVGLFLAQVFVRAGAYFSYKSNVHVAVVYEKELPFPAVTICNQNNFRLTKTLESGKLVYKFIDKIYSEPEIQDVKEFNITDYNETLSKIDLKEFITNAAHQIYDLIDSCRWKGQVCNLSDFRTVYTDLGVCYSFNFDPNETKYTNVAGNRGLSIVMNVEQYEYMRGPQNDAGLKILLHHQNDTPMVKDLGFSVAPGTHTEIGINFIKKLSLESPYGDCQPKAEPLTNCMTQCKAKTTQRMCGCKDLYMNSTNTPVCSMEKAFRCVPYATEIGEGDLGSCQCSSPCEQSLYEHSFSFATLSKFNIERVVLNDPDENLRVREKFMYAKEMTVRNIGKYSQRDRREIQDLLDITFWITGNLTLLSHEWANKSQFSLNYKTFDVIFMMKEILEKDKAKNFFQERELLIDCLQKNKIPDLNGGCYGQRNTTLLIDNVMLYLSNLQDHLNNYKPIEDCFIQYGNLELNISSPSSGYVCPRDLIGSTIKVSGSTIIPWWMTGGSPSTTIRTTTTTLSPEQKMSICREQVQCKADSAMALYNEKPEYLYKILDIVREDINFTKEMLLLNTSRSEDDIKERFEIYDLCLSEVDYFQNITSAYSLESISEMLREFHSLRYGQLEDLLNHTRNMTKLFDYEQLYNSLYYVQGKCLNWVTTRWCSARNAYYYETRCSLHTPSDIVTRFPPIYEIIENHIEKLKAHWTRVVPVYNDLTKFLDGTVTKAYLIDMFSPGLASKLLKKSDLVKDLVDAMKMLKEILIDTETELLQSYKVFFSHDFDWFTHSTFEEFSLIKYLRKLEAEGNINEKIKSALDQLHQHEEVDHQTGFENLLQLVFQIRKDNLQLYIDFLEEKVETQFNFNMDKFSENILEYAEELKMDENFFMANFLQVDIFYKELKSQKIEQMVAFSVISLFSEVGGFLGLLLGASVLTVCELLDYIALLIISRMQKIKPSKVTAFENEKQPPGDSMV